MSESTKKTTAPEQEIDAKPAEAPADANAPKKPKRKISRKAIIIIAAVVVAAIIAAVVIIAVTSGQSEGGEDDDVEFIDVQTNNYYSGVIEPQQTADVNKDPERTVSTVYVKVGDTVKKGDKLFEYDSNETSNKLAKAKIEYEGIQNEIAEAENSISQLSRQRSEAEDETAKADLTTQIQSQESNKSQLQLSLKIKQVEIDNLQNNLDNSVVTSPIDGIIKQISDSADSSDNSGGSGSISSGAFMTVLMNGAYRVRGQVDETNVRSLETGMDVIVHSRNIPDKTWKGTISKVDTSTNADNGSGNNNMMNGDSGDNTASKYNFYVTLDSSEDLLLGEHVYVEPLMPVIDDEVQGDAAEGDAAAENAPADDNAGNAEN